MTNVICLGHQDPGHVEFLPSTTRVVKNLWDAYGLHPQCSPECTGAGTSFNHDVNGHGSHVAGTVGGASVGVAPGANILGVRVLGNNGYGAFSAMIKAIEFVVLKSASRGKRSIISLSVSGGYVFFFFLSLIAPKLTF